jgi:hypothetical protein
MFAFSRAARRWRSACNLSSHKEEMPMTKDKIVLSTLPSNRQSGKIGWALLWLLGIPLPVLLVIYLFVHH